jgi:hypothetical protein
MPKALQVGLLIAVTAILAVISVASFMGAVRAAGDSEASAAPFFLPAFRIGETPDTAPATATGE